MLVELLHPTGPDLVRRLAAALMLVPRSEREAVVSAIERRVVETYGDAAHHGAPAGVVAPGVVAPSVTHISPPVQRPGYVEHIETEYQRPPHVPPAAAPRDAARRTSAQSPRTRAK